MKLRMLTGIIIAGGKSSRVGEDKGLKTFKGKKMVEYPLQLLTHLCDEILISSNNINYGQFGYPVIPDSVADIGPAGGLYSALLHTHNDYNIVLSCDMPFIKPGLLELLLNVKEDYAIIIPFTEYSGYEPLCALYHIDVLPVLEKSIQTGDYKLQNLITKVPSKSILLDNSYHFFSKDLFRNFNFLKDFEI
ncbi:MAG: molybdenum cofactor guanylyltransferase [Bacteroidales bacterium]|nr:molybdenum cofactor guanylyltransferase [Bacteroidales bacterium]